ncbi:MAG: ferredoxin--NADP reductase [Hyphomicrobiales bacterium]|nr:MAG: ferredoxin--NADP reductase [Hyphomicrobiales bacterium]
MSALQSETVLDVHHWTPSMFSFTATRSPSFRFANGQFVMIGLELEGKPLLRAYSLASTNYDEQLEFLSIKVPDGPLTSRLQHIKPGDRILVGRKPTGTLVLDNLTPGRVLYLWSTGTGLAPFLAIIRDPEAYERYEKIVLVHGCRQVAELAYGDRIRNELPKDEFVGELVREKLIYYPTVTREPFWHQGRITELVETGKLFTDTGMPPLDAEHDRVMMCGSPQMIADLKVMLEGRGFIEGANHTPGQFVVERAFVEK